MKTLSKILLLVVFVVFADKAIAQNITKDMVYNAQNTWVQALVSIGQAHVSGGDATARANEVLTTYYDFANGTVLFKPTLTHGKQTFRFTKEGALAYFVGGNEAYPDDNGFALRPYVSGTVEMGEVVVHGNTAIAMSNITLKAYDGSTVTVNKTFGYRLDDSGNLIIITHHSSLPFQP